MTQIGDQFPNVLTGVGIDVLFGLGGADSLTGSEEGNNLLAGNRGNDTLRSRAPEDTMFGGQGNDVLISAGSALMNGNQGDDTLIGDPSGGVPGVGLGGGDIMFGGQGNDVLESAAGGRSLLFGNRGQDNLKTNGSGDIAFGGQGDDRIEVGSVAALAYGDMGNDTLIAPGSTGGATLFGGSADGVKNRQDGNDIIISGGGNLIFGNGGNDLIFGSRNDRVYGGQGADSISIEGGLAFGDQGPDAIVGLGNATVDGGAGSNVLTALGSGNVLTAGGSQTNTFILGTGAVGNRVILGSGTVAQIIDASAAGPGNTIDASASGGEVRIESTGGNYIILGSGVVIGTAPTDSIIFVPGWDSINPPPGPDEIVLPPGTATGTTIGGISSGGDGTPPAPAPTPAGTMPMGFIVGTPASEPLMGGTTNDTIEGLGGSDTLTGGLGADVFLFRGANLAAVGIPAFNGAIVGGTAQTYSYLYGGPVIGATAYGTSVAGTIVYSGGTAVLQFSAGGTIAFVNGVGQIEASIPFEVSPPPDAGASAVNIVQGTSPVPGASFTVQPSPTSSGGTFAGAGYGYSSSGFDVITDFETGTDKIAIQASMIGIAGTGGGITIGNASAAIGQFPSTNLAYDSTTGVLYFLPSPSAAPFIGPVSTYGTAAVFRQARMGLLGTTGDLSNINTPVFGDGGLANSFGELFGGTFSQTGTVAIQTTYTFGTVGVAIGFPSAFGTTSGGIAAAGTMIPIPFLQVLNGNNPLPSLNFSDITLF